MQNNKTPQIREPAATPLQSRESPAGRILMVEDDGVIRRLNAQVLVQSGYHVDAAEDGAAAWDTLQVNRYDLMVTDNDMPKVSGVELLHMLHEARMALPVIMATGQSPEAEFSRFPWLQPAAMLIKPYSFIELLETVRNVLLATGAARGDSGPPDLQTGCQPEICNAGSLKPG